MFDPRMVHASSGTGFPNRSSDGPYTPSTRRNGLSDRQNVTGRVDIAVVVSPALRAAPSAYTQRERVQQIPADRTGFTTRKEAVDLHDRLGFGFDHPNRGADRGVREGTGKAVVLNQAPEMEIFNIDRIEPCRQHGAQLVQGIASGVGDLFMQSGDPAGLNSAPIRPLLLLGQAPLGTGQQHGLASEVARVWDRLTVRQGRQAGHAEIDADGFAGLGSCDRLHLDDHRDVVAARRMERDRHRARIGGHGATDCQCQDAQLGQRQPLCRQVKPEGAPSVLGAVTHSALLFERRVGAALGEEIGERGLQMPKGLLKRDTRDFVEECQLGIFLERGQLGASAHKRQPFTMLERQRSSGQHAVMDQSATAKGLRQVFRLLRRGVGSKVPSSFHSLIINNLAIEVKSTDGTRFLPALNDGVSARVVR